MGVCVRACVRVCVCVGVTCCMYFTENKSLLDGNIEYNTCTVSSSPDNSYFHHVYLEIIIVFSLCHSSENDIMHNHTPRPPCLGTAEARNCRQ